MTDSYAATWRQTFASTVGVEDALTELSCEAARALEVGPAATARMHNLVAISTDTASHAAVDRVLAAMAEVHPSRLVRVRLDPAAPDGVQAQASVRCHVEGDLRCPIVYETVEIATGGNAGRHLAEIVAPVLEADLPVVLWWTGHPPFGDPAFEELLPLVDRLLLDSAALGSTGLRALADVLPTSPPVVDLAWGRLRPWRETIAAAFDHPPLDSAIREVRAVEIDVAGASVEGRLLAGWLAVKLGWQVARPLAGGRVGRGAFVRSGAVIPLVLAKEDGPAAIRRLAIEAGGYHLALTARGDWADVRLARDDLLLSEQRLPLVIPDDATLVSRALMRGGRDRDWEAAMSVTAILVSP
ncbi:MAG: hypothetical protein KatS3mg060_1795 [Dehalococcoidia bacterium]|nr:MAG: hypothetical protein KatS3mg060_1795 [Dehalococcoidia bacterium]